ncbi:MAG: hypothetical protein FRX49_12658 [Trebouxia sp. A1-2]|nr:MAG: hypothetical protein FRX49_12658 [Trebouxia sp. A1-2]
MDSQLEAVRQDIREVKGKIAKIEQNLAEQAHNAEREKSFFDLLLSLNNRLSGLQEETNILLRSQTPSSPSAVDHVAAFRAKLAVHSISRPIADAISRLLHHFPQQC